MTDAPNHIGEATTKVPDELAMAVERVTADLTFADKVAARFGGTSNRSMFSVSDLRLILSRLASQEETIRADGECLERLASSEAFDLPQAIDGPLAEEMRMRMDYAAARLSARQEGGAG